MRLLLVSTTIDGVTTGLAGVALQSYLLAQPDLAGRWQVERLEIPYPTPWWYAPPFGDDVVDTILERAPDVLGLTLLCWDLAAQLDLAKRVRQRRPAVIIVVGGPSASSWGPALLQREPALDALVRGEGELPLAALLRARWPAVEGIKGLSWRARDGAVHSGRDFARGLPFAELPSPLTAGVYEPRWVANVEFARGCAQRCRFCDWRRYRSGVRRAGAERMRADLAAAAARCVPTTCVLDSALNADVDHLEALAAAWEQSGAGQRTALRGFVRAAGLGARELAALARLKLQGAEVSLNSVNAAPLVLAGRAPVDEAAFERSVEALAASCPLNLHLILGMPGDDLAGFRRTLAFVHRLLQRFPQQRLPVVTVFWMIVERGSFFWRRREALGLRTSSEGVPYVLATEGFDQSDLLRAAQALQDQPHADRFRLDGPRELLDGGVDPRVLVAPVPR